MKRLLVWSDLHNEFWNELPKYPETIGEIDAVLLPGDISTKGRHLECLLRIWDMFRVPVVGVRGNHDFYHLDMAEVPQRENTFLKAARAKGVEIHILDREAFMLNDLRILGATLWTDMQLFPDLHRDARELLARAMSDFNHIKVGPVRWFDTGDWLQRHYEDRAWLLDELAQPHHGQTLVMTHHMPAREALHPMRVNASPKEQLMNAGYASDLWPQICHHDIHTWVFGHTHDQIDVTLEGEHGPVRFSANPRGYPHEKCPFRTDFVLEIPSRPIDPPAP